MQSMKSVPSEHGNISLEDALYLIHQGQSNVAITAKKVGVSLEEMKRLFDLYVSQHSIDPGAWETDVELSWPWS